MKQLCRHLARHLEVLAYLLCLKRTAKVMKKYLGLIGHRSQRINLKVYDSNLDFRNNYESGDSVDHDDRSSEPLLKLMKDLPNEEPSILPEGFLFTFEERLRSTITPLDDDYAPNSGGMEMVDIFKGVLEAMYVEADSRG
jgi:hypothetical protein